MEEEAGRPKGLPRLSAKLMSDLESLSFPLCPLSLGIFVPILTLAPPHLNLTLTSSERFSHPHFTPTHPLLSQTLVHSFIAHFTIGYYDVNLLYGLLHPTSL